MGKVNSMCFAWSKDSEREYAMRFVETLLDWGRDNADSYCQVKLEMKGMFLDVLWTVVDKDGEWGTTFEPVDEDQLVVKEIRFPDGHYEYAVDEGHEKYLWERFHEENPGWYRNDFGIWTRKEENQE